MRFCFVSTRRGSHFMTELLWGLSAEAATAGHTVDFAFDEFPPLLHDEDVYIVIPHEFQAWCSPGAFPDARQRARTIALCTENPGTEWFEATYQLLPQFAAAISMNRASAAELQRRGISCEHMQLGYSPLWDSWGGDASVNRHIDVLYLGAADPRRDPLLGACGRHLWARECQFLVPPLEPRTSPRPDFLSGAEKYHRLRSARVLLNLHRTTSAALEWMRFLEAICNGCVVVSEPCLDNEPLAAGEHFLTATADSIALVIDRLLDEPDRLRLLRERAYDFVREELPMGPAVNRLAEVAAGLPRLPPGTRQPHADAQTTHPGTHMMHPSTPTPQAKEAPAIAAQALVPGPSTLSSETHEPPALLRSISRRLPTRIVPRVLRSRRPHGQVLAQSPAYASATPRVSVAVAVDDCKREVLETLESVAASRYRQLEVLIVDDRPSGQSTPQVRSFLDHHPSLAAALLEQPHTRGLARARNILAEHARGEYVFILDAGGEIYPSTLERLVGALDADPQATFSYPMVAVFDGDRPEELLSSLPWEPERLKSGNWIDPMVLIRRDRLLELGGYATDPRLAGWEDFHLWCQCAEAGGHSVHVPQVLGWRRRTAATMPRDTEADAPAKWELMGARFPRLLGVAGAA
jgi:hypothetical protein